MDFLDVIFSRKSVRSFQDKTISNDILQQILEAGRLAPSWQNKQCWHFIVIKNKEKRKQLALQSGLIGTVNFFIKDAPIIIVACASPIKSGMMNNQNYYLVDTAIAFQQMMLTAWNFGIGSCWLGAFNEGKVKKNLAIPEEMKVVAISPFGYPKNKDGFYAKAVKTFAKSKKRKELSEIISYEKWS
ncbi:MAG: nitroreductase [Candidatus Cloacimonetes bacterium]|jgi:nitroreductase|nr:nitroreductase [Candidatus Cloacimonadota bacterium]MBT6994837.1 nitroreductase [Candidatus Cloacimonadota bacterium]MBT7469215.1 nitroreductase [Candidatus Cloacimonadota bacterium]